MASIIDKTLITKVDNNYCLKDNQFNNLYNQN